MEQLEARSWLCWFYLLETWVLEIFVYAATLDIVME
jgi:hypothetical protein